MHTYLNATVINIYKQIEQIFINTEQNMYILKYYPELCKEDLIAEIRCYKKHYNNMNLNNIIIHFKIMSNEVIQFFSRNSNTIKTTYDITCKFVLSGIIFKCVKKIKDMANK